MVRPLRPRCHSLVTLSRFDIFFRQSHPVRISRLQSGHHSTKLSPLMPPPPPLPPLSESNRHCRRRHVGPGTPPPRRGIWHAPPPATAGPTVSAGSQHAAVKSRRRRSTCTPVCRLCGRYLAILGRPIRITVPAVTVAPTALVGSLIRSSNLPHSLQRGVLGPSPRLGPPLLPHPHYPPPPSTASSPAPLHWRSDMPPGAHCGP